jgi:hypothetical protein
MTIRELGDAVGFEPTAIEQIELMHESLDHYPLFFIKVLAQALKLPATLIVFS